MARTCNQYAYHEYTNPVKSPRPLNSDEHINTGSELIPLDCSDNDCSINVVHNILTSSLEMISTHTQC